MARNYALEKLRRDVRSALADYMHTEGCGCCSKHEEHNEDAERLAKLLNVPMFSDRSGYQFHAYSQRRADLMKRAKERDRENNS